MFGARRLIVVTGCLLMACSTALVFGTQVQIGSQRYVNREFGFSIQIPAGRPTCGAEPDTHDTGIMIFLDRGPSGCHDRNKRASIAVNGTYNAMDARSPLQLLSVFCLGAQPKRTSAEEFGNIEDLWPAMCEIEREDGFVNLIFARQSRVTSVGAIPRINYTMVIRVPSGKLRRDMEGMKAMLRSVRFFQPAE